MLRIANPSPYFEMFFPGMRTNYISTLVVAFFALGLIFLFAAASQYNGSLATSGGVCKAISGFFRTIDLRERDETRSRSGFCLQEALKVLEKATETLETYTNSRVEWLKCARLIYRAKQLAQAVTETDHRQVLDAYMEDYRVRIFNVLSMEGRSKTGAFYYGVDPALELDDAAITCAPRVLDRRELGDQGFEHGLPSVRKGRA